MPLGWVGVSPFSHTCYFVEHRVILGSPRHLRFSGFFHETYEKNMNFIKNYEFREKFMYFMKLHVFHDFFMNFVRFTRIS